MPDETEIPLTHPMRVAWERYRSTGEFLNTIDWPTRDTKHLEGALWAAFCKGWEMRSDLAPSEATAHPDGRVQIAWTDPTVEKNKT